VDKNAAYPKAIDKLKADKTLSKTTELRRVKYLNNMVEQDHRFIKRLVNPGIYPTNVRNVIICFQERKSVLDDGWAI
jgi:transposase-like protein